MKRVRKAPVRTCVGCGRSDDKRDLVRVVRTAEGHVTVDPTGKSPGRGAYVCADQACFEAAARKRRFDSALRVRLMDDDTDRLARELAHALTASDSSRQGR